MGQIWGGGSGNWQYPALVTPSGELVVTTGSGSSVLPGTITTVPKGLAQLVGTSGNWTYYMDAEPGANWSGAVWRISRRKANVTASGITVTATQWASGNSNFDKRAIVFAVYPYS